jgi:hypothetical protein
MQSPQELEAELRRLATAPSVETEAIERWQRRTLAGSEPIDELPKSSVLARTLGPRPFGPYRVVGSLGAGGMGIVLEVRHEETGGRYALKTVLTRDPERLPRVLARFRREAELNARLDHPGVVRIHAAALEGTRPYLVQDLLTGGSLGARVEREGTLYWEEALRVTREIAAALCHAHERGVVHRDLKPENVLFGEDGRVRLVDFGLAVSLAEGSLRLTNTGEIVGSPSYMAPEQISGGSAEPPVDVYALGALLFFMLSGEAPFESEATNLVALFRATMELPPRPPSELCPQLPPGIDGLTLALLAKEPERRPSLSEVVEWLEGVEGGYGADPRGLSPRKILGLVGASLLLLAFGVWAVLEHRRAARIELARAYLASHEGDLLGPALDPAELAVHLEAVPPEEGLHRRLQALHMWGRLRRGEGQSATLPPGETTRLERLVALLVHRAEGIPRARLRERLKRVGEHPSRAAVLELLSATPGELEEAQHAGRIAPDVVAAELRLRLRRGYDDAFARPGEHGEVVSLAERAAALGVDLHEVEASKQAALDRHAATWLSSLAQGQFEARVQALGALLRAAPRVPAGASLELAVHEFLGGEVRRQLPGVSEDYRVLCAFLRVNGLLILELGTGCRPGELESFEWAIKAQRKRHAEVHLDALGLVGALEVIAAQDIFAHAANVDPRALDAQARRSGWGTRLSYVGLAVRHEAMSRGTVSAEVTARLSLALEQGAHGLPAKHQALARTILAYALANVADAKNAKELEPEASRAIARAHAWRKNLVTAWFVRLVEGEARMERLSGGNAWGLLAWSRAMKVAPSLPTRSAPPPGSAHYSVGKVVLRLAEAMLGNGQVVDARPFVERALKIQRANFKELGAQGVMAWCLRAEGKPEEAWRTIQAIPPASWSRTEATCAEAAIQLAGRGRLAEALEVLSKGIRGLPASARRLTRLRKRLRAKEE